MSKMGESFEKDQYINQLEGLIKYQEAYDILMEHFDDFDSKTKTTIHVKLKKLGL